VYCLNNRLFGWLDPQIPIVTGPEMLYTISPVSKVRTQIDHTTSEIGAQSVDLPAKRDPVTPPREVIHSLTSGDQRAMRVNR
jgi:hypothetical protein